MFTRYREVITMVLIRPQLIYLNHIIGQGEKNAVLYYLPIILPFRLLYNLPTFSVDVAITDIDKVKYIRTLR